jgi:hypothetical protein
VTSESVPVLGASRAMTPDEIVDAAERMDVIDHAITIPALWPRLILERERRDATARIAELEGALREIVDLFAREVPFVGGERQSAFDAAVVAAKAALPSTSRDSEVREALYEIAATVRSSKWDANGSSSWVAGWDYARDKFLALIETILDAHSSRAVSGATGAQIAYLEGEAVARGFEFERAVADLRAISGEGPEPPIEFAWLIEDGRHSGYPEGYEPPIYYAAEQRRANYPSWTKDAFAAMRFASKAEAAAFMESQRDGDRPMPGYPVDHGFFR